MYNIYFSPTEYNINMKDYPYYFIGVDYGTTDIIICYNKDVMSIRKEQEEYYEYTGNNTCFWIKVKISGEVIVSHYNNVSTWGIKIGKEDYIVSNYDMYYGQELIYEQNHGYKYKPENEEKNKCDEVVKLKEQNYKLSLRLQIVI